MVETFVSGDSVSVILLSGFSVSRRDGSLVRGLCTGSDRVHQELAEYLKITLADTSVNEIRFHGAQRKEYVLRIAEIPPGTQGSVSHKD